MSRNKRAKKIIYALTGILLIAILVLGGCAGGRGGEAAKGSGVQQAGTGEGGTDASGPEQVYGFEGAGRELGAAAAASAEAGRREGSGGGEASASSGASDPASGADASAGTDGAGASGTADGPQPGTQTAQTGPAVTLEIRCDALSRLLPDIPPEYQPYYNGRTAEDVKAATPADGCILGTVTYYFGEGECIADAVASVCADYGVQISNPSGGYIEGLGGLWEFDAGVNSGWMVSDDGVPIDTGINSWPLKDGHHIKFFFTVDYRQE